MVTFSVLFVRGGLVALMLCVWTAVRGGPPPSDMPDNHPMRIAFAVMFVWGVVALFAGAFLYALGPT